MVKTFGRFEFDDRRRQLVCAGQPVRLSGQALDLLCLLLDRPGELVTREEIERRLWPDRHVNVDHSLDVIVSRLRAVLGEEDPRPRYIETVPRRGYRFIELVAVKAEGTTDPPPRAWRRRLGTYAAIALLAALLAVVYARTRYDKFVPHRSGPASMFSPDR